MLVLEIREPVSTFYGIILVHESIMSTYYCIVLWNQNREFVHVIYYKHINITCPHITHHSSTYHPSTNHPTTHHSSINHPSTIVVSIKGKIVHNLSLAHNKVCHMQEVFRCNRKSKSVP